MKKLAVMLAILAVVGIPTSSVVAKASTKENVNQVSVNRAHYLEDGDFGEVTGNDVCIRTSAGGGRIIAYANRGDGFTVHGREGSYYEISYRGQTAYISVHYLS